MSADNRIKQVYVLSHTHWDREWYQDFQGFRKRLVYTIDELLSCMENDPDYLYFTMDGQTIVLDDYLEMRPENKHRLQKLIQSGRIAIGPWYVMPDEFLVSGESLIRNLLKGIRKSRSWGVEPMKSGYVTDIFGHNSQFPQILQGFGIDNAVLFRGFHGDADASEIWWEAADGSRVLGLKLDEDRCYSDFYFALRWPFFDRDNAYEENKEELLERAKQLMEYKNKRATTSIAIGMDGVDHTEIEPQLPWMLKTLNESAELGVEFIHAHLETYIKELRSKIGELKVFKGEQKALGYSGINNWVPENVLSSRIHLKQQNHHCETLLEKWVEPLGVMTALEGLPYGRTFIAKSWEFLMQNHPHDSICGCSIDQVHQDMMYRFDQSRSISEAVIKEQLQFISNHLSADALNGNQAFVLFNTTQSPVEQVIEVEIALPANTDAAVALSGSNLQGTSFRIYNAAHEEIPYQLLEINKSSSSLYRPYRELPRAETADRFRISLPVKVQAYGYTTFILERYTIEMPEGNEYSASKLVPPVRYSGSMQVNDSAWDNGRILLEIQSNGIIQITDHESGAVYNGLLALEDEADIGDGWSHMAPVSNEKIKSTGAQTVISTVFDGRFHTRIRVRMNLMVPKAIANDEMKRSEELVEIPLSTFIDLKKGDPIVYCRTIIHNTARDHRLKVMFPTGFKDAKHFQTSTPFDLIRREISQPDFSDYFRKAYEVVPHNGIVTVDDGNNGLAVFSKGLYEVGMRDDNTRTIALTLFRSTRKEVGKDPGDGGQMLRELSFEYAIRPYLMNASIPALLWKEHQQYVTGIRTIDRKPGKVYAETPHHRKADLPLTKSFLNFESKNLIVSAFKASEDEENSYILRLFNCTEIEASGIITFDRSISAAFQVNLDEEISKELSFATNRLNLTAKPKQIISLKIQLSSQISPDATI